MPSLSSNKKAYFDYEILDTFEAGLILLGHEVKAARNNQVSLKGSFISTQDDRCFLKNANISKYKYAANIKDHDPLRPRELLLHKNEREKIQAKSSQKGLSVVPIEMYTKGNRIKLKIAIVKGKKKHDKRADLKKKSIDRDVERAMRKFR